MRPASFLGTITRGDVVDRAARVEEDAVTSAGDGEPRGGPELEPFPETGLATAELGVLSTDDDLLDQLLQVGRAVRRVVPTCRGLSLAVVEQGVTLTLVASDEDTIALDAVQYLDGGPCVEAIEGHPVVIGDRADLDERGWRLYSAATAARGVASSLSLPVLEHGVVVGGVNLYAGTPRAFRDRHHQLADLLGAWARGAVTNADLSFCTRLAAQQTPQVLHDTRRVEVAVGILAERRRTSTEEARRRLGEAAAAAGVPVVMVAETVLPPPGDARGPAAS